MKSAAANFNPIIFFRPVEAELKTFSQEKSLEIAEQHHIEVIEDLSDMSKIVVLGKRNNIDRETICQPKTEKRFFT